MFLTPGTSVVAAGVVSGLCFLIINGLRKGKAAASGVAKKSISDDSRCACCLKPFVLDRGVECGECGARACRKGCSRWDTPDNSWHCVFCHQRRLWLRRNDKWFETFGGVPDHELAPHRFSTAKSQVYIAGVEHAGFDPGLGSAAGGPEDEDSVETVRDFVEKIVEGLVGNVDETPIDRLYDHPAYDQLMDKHKPPIAGSLARLAVSLQLSVANKPATDTPTMAHTALRELVERAVEEARKLPGLGGTDSGRVHQVDDFSDQTYEDLLATAILNKVMEKYQKERVDGNSNVLHHKTTSRPKYITSEIEVGLDEGVEEGSSSLEPLSQDEYSSDCSAPPTKFSRNCQEPLSLTIEERIEEVTTTYTSDEEPEQSAETNGLNFGNARRVPFPEFGMDIIDPSQESSEDTHDETTAATHVDLVTPVESWEENWLFQKKKMQATSEPVAMLVPNPSEDYKALIGDKDAEDTSDLSECSAQSDDEIEEELFEAINNVVPKIPDPEPKSLPHLENKAERVGNQIPRNNTGCQENLKGLPKNTNGVHEGMAMKGDDKTHQNDIKEQTADVGKGPEIKLSVEDMLVFHMSDSNTAKQQERKHQDETDLTEKKQYPETKQEANIKIGNGGVSQLTRETKLAADDLMKDFNDSQLTKDIKLQETDTKRPQLTRDIKISEDQSEIKPTKEHLVTSSVDNSLPSPAKVPMDLYSLDEKLVSMESRIDKQLDCLDKSLNNYVQSTDGILNSLTDASNNLVGVSEAAEGQLISLGSVDQVDSAKSNGHHKIDVHSEDGAQQESEYTEHYDTATQRHLDSLTRTEKAKVAEVAEEDLHEVPPPIPTSPPPIEMLGQCREAIALADVQPVQPKAVERQRVEMDIALSAPPRPGTIAEREHKKWENAAPMENNPYSEENIQKRLWDRQYTRTASTEASGENSEPPKTPSNPLQVVLGASEPDFKRYGRDYYINDAKKASGEKARRSIMSNSGRPGSSLSQASSLTGSDPENQEQIQYVEPEPAPDATSNFGTKVSSWKRNSVETTPNKQQPRPRQRVEATILLESSSYDADSKEIVKESMTEVDGSWQNTETKEILENERRNSKNEMNAKLNNQEDFRRSHPLETRKSRSDENQKTINRIDLKAYGFGTSSSKDVTRNSESRVVNKLDLKSFGYDTGVRRTQSINQMDTKINNNFGTKPMIITMKSKSNRTESPSDHELSKSSNDLADYEGSIDLNKAKSTEALPEGKKRTEIYIKVGGMSPAKSMPNVAKNEHYSEKFRENHSYEYEEDIIINTFSKKAREEERLRQEMIKSSSKSHGLWKSETTLLFPEKSRLSEICSDKDLEELMTKAKSTEVLSKKERFEKTTEEVTSLSSMIVEDLPMPSVRRLAQTFNKAPEVKTIASTRVLQPSNSFSKKRSTTPEIHIVESPRQMHSLTARSLSREFREGLRQIPNKMTSLPTSQVILEQTTTQQNNTEVTHSVPDNASHDKTSVAPGKLKNNLKFWEQLERRS